jgi:hypothetical protein
VNYPIAKQLGSSHDIIEQLIDNNTECQKFVGGISDGIE